MPSTNQLRYIVRRNGEAWLVVDRTSMATMAHFASRRLARDHARELNALGTEHVAA